MSISPNLKIPLEDNLFIAGRTGSGKSYFFKNTILPKLMTEKRQIIIIDMKKEYDIGIKVNINSLDCIERIAEIEIGKYTLDKNKNPIPPKILVIDAHRYQIDQIDMIFQYLNYSKNKILIFEESAFFFGTPKIKTGYLPEETEVFLRCGTNQHNHGHNIIFITQYPNDIPKKVLSVCSRGYLFYLSMAALQYLYDKQFIEDRPEEVKAQISPFRSYKYYIID